MLPVAIVRKQVLGFYAVDRQTASQAAERLAKVADDVAELSMSRVAGCIVALWRHRPGSGYEKRLQARSGQYYGNAYQDAKDEVNDGLRAKLEVLRVK